MKPVWAVLFFKISFLSGSALALALYPKVENLSTGRALPAMTQETTFSFGLSLWGWITGTNPGAKPQGAPSTWSLPASRQGPLTFACGIEYRWQGRRASSPALLSLSAPSDPPPTPGPGDVMLDTDSISRAQTSPPSSLLLMEVGRNELLPEDDLRNLEI